MVENSPYEREVRSLNTRQGPGWHQWSMHERKYPANQCWQPLLRGVHGMTPLSLLFRSQYCFLQTQSSFLLEIVNDGKNVPPPQSINKYML